MADRQPPRFACDAMLGGLARWLRAAGYDASWHAGIRDWDLLHLAAREGRFLLSSDTGIFRIGIIRDGDQPALFVPHRLSPQGELAYVLHKLCLSLRPPRCMACGGELREVPREAAAGRVPPRSLSWLDQFWECSWCGKVFWKGTHWQRIEAQLHAAVRKDSPGEPGMMRPH